MDKATKLLRAKLNHLEKDIFDSNPDDGSMTSVSNDKSLNTEFYKVMTYIKKYYESAYKRTLNKLSIMPLRQSVNKLKHYKTYFKHKNKQDGYPKTDVLIEPKKINHFKANGDKLIYLDKSDGSLYELESINFFFLRIIINTLRMFLKLPLTKREAYREIATDMTYNSDPIESGLMEEEAGDISDQYDMDMSQDSCNMCLNQAVGDLRPEVEFLKSISNLDNNWFLVTNVNYSLDSDSVYDMSAVTKFKPTNNIKDKITDTSDMKEFKNYLKDIHVPLYKTMSDNSDFYNDPISDDLNDFSDDYDLSDENADVFNSNSMWSDDSDFSDDSDYEPIIPAPDLDDPQGLYNQIHHLYDIIMEIPNNNENDSDGYYYD